MLEEEAALVGLSLLLLQMWLRRLLLMELVEVEGVEVEGVEAGVVGVEVRVVVSMQPTQCRQLCELG